MKRQLVTQGRVAAGGNEVGGEAGVQDEPATLDAGGVSVGLDALALVESVGNGQNEMYGLDTRGGDVQTLVESAGDGQNVMRSGDRGGDGDVMYVGEGPHIARGDLEDGLGVQDGGGGRPAGAGQGEHVKHTTAPATGARSATDVKQQHWAAGGKCPRSGKLSLPRSKSLIGDAATRSVQPAEAQRATQALLKRAAILDASISEEQRKKARSNRQEAVVRRDQRREAAEDEWLRESDWSSFDPDMRRDGGGEQGEGGRADEKGGH